MLENKNDLIFTIKQKFSQLSKGQKLIAQFILENYDKAAFMTACKLGETVGVSESTVVRFANALGFDGYPKLQKALQELIKTKLTTVQRVEMSKEYSDDWNILRKVLKSDIENIKGTLDEIDINSFQYLVNQTLNARRIYIVGLRSSTAIAEYLGFYLNLILDNVKVVGYGISDLFEQILNVGKDDLVIGISFPRYSKKTLELFKYAKGQGATLVSLTDSVLSPIATLSDETIIIKSNMASFVDSLVAPLSFANALIIAVGMRKKDEITKYFDKLEYIWKEYSIYDEK
ncbi:transcriptional regulator, RpiR family [Alkalithermobacter thermoalcaliphilus JW-YL-7 = DSM 7308]|uniref:Transcriptional regulator, RpiR family n=1 Tax=Alkalithermobacter thermoalcaliphilus JW-YL-7 = DSM 7308 TaxID=1121328 RepID=A0A150FS72_CLOPD|nr:transcriptional regulator, RpiR family [[Clostridium] paradoxum JW-YL-7 = DSM 7308]SHK78951.1 transcriptional regulator, RpiR family [[Clostridium] paradoxum JW-YL-7 = DSM 7308]